MGRVWALAQERGLYRDADAGYEDSFGGLLASRIVIHGESLGTAVAKDLAARRQCAGLILEAPFTSMGEMAATVVPVVGPISVRGFNTTDKIRKINAPVLIVHCDCDEVVPIRQGVELVVCRRRTRSSGKWQVLTTRHRRGSWRGTLWPTAKLLWEV